MQEAESRERMSNSWRALRFQRTTDKPTHLQKVLLKQNGGKKNQVNYPRVVTPYVVLKNSEAPLNEEWGGNKVNREEQSKAINVGDCHSFTKKTHERNVVCPRSYFKPVDKIVSNLYLNKLANVHDYLQLKNTQL